MTPRELLAVIVARADLHRFDLQGERVLFQFVKNFGNQGIRVALFLQPSAQKFRLNVAVALALESFAFLPVAEIIIAKVGRILFVREQSDHALLGLAFFLANSAHALWYR